MCGILVPALIGVGALALLGGGGGAIGGCDTCATGPVPAVSQSGNYTITIPQLAGEGTNVTAASAGPSYAYAPPMQGPAYAPQGAAYGQVPAGPSGYDYGAPPPQPPYSAYTGDAGVGASVDYNGQSALGAGGYADPNGIGVGANVGGMDASVGLGSRTY